MASEKSEIVAVTGVAGYIASHVAVALLRKGYHVRGTVRSLADTSKYQFLQKIAAELNASERLTFHEADLLREGSYDEAVAGCTFVIHCASPFIIGKVSDPQAVFVDPAVHGTENVLNAVARHPSVTRVVLTSSVAAVYGSNADKPGHVYNEDDWNTTSSLTEGPYSFSKVQAERRAWELAKAQSQYTLVTINPSFVMGPSLSGRADSASVTFLTEMLSGKMPAAPHLEFGVVDVRDVADAHVAAMETSGAQGRYICSKESVPIMAMADALRPHFPNNRLPAFTLPKLLMYLVGPFSGFSWAFVSNNIGHSLRIDNSKIQRDLGITFPRPLATTLTEMADELVKSGAVQRR